MKLFIDKFTPILKVKYLAHLRAFVKYKHNIAYSWLDHLYHYMWLLILGISKFKIGLENSTPVCSTYKWYSLICFLSFPIQALRI